MISLDTARQLKEAGLIWHAATNDFFAIPDRGMDDRIFVLSDLQAQLDLFRGWPVVTFHGTAEWALDYILTSEIIWLPREEQLRDLLLSLHPDMPESGLSLIVADHQYICSMPWSGTTKAFEASNGGDAYGKALLFVLKNVPST
jgi:hypothetical protein